MQQLLSLVKHEDAAKQAVIYERLGSFLLILILIIPSTYKIWYRSSFFHWVIDPQKL